MKKSYLTHTRQTHPSLSGTPYTHSASLTGGVAWTRIRLPVRLAIHVRRSRSPGRSLRSIALALILRYVGIVLLRHSVVAASVFSRLLPLERGVLPPGGGGLGQRLHARMGICRGGGLSGARARDTDHAGKAKQMVARLDQMAGRLGSPCTEIPSAQGKPSAPARTYLAVPTDRLRVGPAAGVTRYPVRYPIPSCARFPWGQPGGLFSLPTR